MGKKKDKSSSVIQLQRDLIRQKHPLIWIMNSFDEAVQLIDPYEEGYPNLYVNEKFMEMTGYSQEELFECRQDMLMCAETSEAAAKKIADVIQKEEDAAIEVSYCHKDGRRFLKEIYANPLYNDEHELFAYIIKHKDVAHRKIIDRKKEQEIWFTALATYATMVSFIHLNGIVGTPRITSPSVTPITLHEGQYFTESIMEEDKEKAHKYFLSALQGNVENVRVRLVVEIANNDEIELDILYIPCFNNQGEIEGVHAISRNITGSSQMQELLTNVEKYDIVRRTLLSVADVIYHPTSMLKGFAQLAIAETPESSVYSSLMQTEISRLELFSEGLPYLTHPRVITLKKQNLRTIIKEVCEAMYSPALSQNVEISYSYKATTEYIPCDKTGIETVLVHLLKNAMEALLNGGIIRVEVFDSGTDSVVIRVIDNGTGIPKENLAKIKLPFYTTKNDRLGLGLMICSNLVKEHKGILTFTSEEGEGTAAEIVLPVE